MGLMDFIKRNTKEAIETTKASLVESLSYGPFGLGEVYQLVTDNKASKEGWEKIEVEGLFGSDHFASSACEVGLLKGNGLPLDIKGYGGGNYFYVGKGQKSKAVSYLKSRGLDVK